MEATDALSMAQVDDLVEHWRDEPPLAVCVRAYLGIKPRERASKEPEVITEQEWEQLKRAGEAHAAMNGRA